MYASSRISSTVARSERPRSASRRTFVRSVGVSWSVMAAMVTGDRTSPAGISARHRPCPTPSPSRLGEIAPEAGDAAQAAVGCQLADVDAGDERRAVGLIDLPGEAQLVAVLVDAAG